MKQLIKRYSLLFWASVFAYSFLHWLLVLKLRLFILPERLIDLWIPLVIGFLLSLFFFKRMVRKYFGYIEHKRDLFTLILCPMSIWISIAFLQNTIRDFHYSLIKIDEPQQVKKYPDQKFFSISNYYITKSRYFILQEEHTSGKGGHTLNVNDYYVLPFYRNGADTLNITDVAVGIKYYASINNGFLSSGQEEKKRFFHEKSMREFLSTDFHSRGFFILESYTEDEDCFRQCYGYNPYVDHTRQGFILSYHQDNFADHLHYQISLGLLAPIVIYLVVVIVMACMGYFHIRKKRPRVNPQDE